MENNLNLVSDMSVLDGARDAYEQYDLNKDRFKMELRIHHHAVADYYEIVEALFFDNKLVGSQAVSDKFESKEAIFEYARNTYHALRRNMLVTQQKE